MTTLNPSGLSTTQIMMADMEELVARQWKKAHGKGLAHSTGFSWKTRSKRSRRRQTTRQRRVIARRRPTGRVARQRSRSWVTPIVVAALLVGVALGLHALFAAAPLAPPAVLIW